MVLGMSASCSEHIPTKSEQFYLDAADSLKLYHNFTYLKKQLASSEKTRDLLKMDYVDFKQKHNWNDDEMEVFANVIQGHVSIAKTINEKNSGVE